MAIVHACIMAVVHACSMAIVHVMACPMSKINVSGGRPSQGAYLGDLIAAFRPFGVQVCQVLHQGRLVAVFRLLGCWGMFVKQQGLELEGAFRVRF